jgi:hypothetical protein
MEKGLLCVAALARLDQYIDEKDMAGECVCRVATLPAKIPPDGTLYTDTALHFYFEFPVEYANMCVRVYYPEALEYIKGIDTVSVEVVKKIEASNRYASDETDKCALLFIIPKDLWRSACARVFQHHREKQYIPTAQLPPLGELFPADLTNLMHAFVSTISQASNQHGLISDDPDDPNYRVPRPWD